MRAGNADLRMSQTTATRKTRVIVTLHHRIAARSDAQIKPHKIGRNQLGAAYAAVIVPPLVLFSIRRRSLSDR